MTVTPTTNHTGANFVYLDASDSTLDDADNNTAGHQVALAVGDTVFKVKVTAEDGTSTQTYTVTVTRAAGDTAPGLVRDHDGGRNSGGARLRRDRHARDRAAR